MRVEQRSSRRTFLAGAAAATALWVARPLLKSSGAAEAVAVPIVAAKAAKVPVAADDAAWSAAAAAQIQLLPQLIAVPRVTEAGAKAVTVRALYDDDRLGILLEWLDAHKDVDLGTVQEFRDGAAIQFPQSPATPYPAFTMGSPGKPVTIYHWKSDWQFGLDRDVDEANPNMYSDWYPFSGVEAGAMAEASDYISKGDRTFLTAAAVGNSLADPEAQKRIGPVQKMRSEGFGTIETDATQDAAGGGAYQNGSWKIAFSIPRKQAGFTFSEGETMPLAFALWDGAREERNGQKAYSIWQNMSLGTPKAAGGGIGEGTGPFLLGGAAAALAALGAGIALRMRRMRGQTEATSKKS